MLCQALEKYSLGQTQAFEWHFKVIQMLVQYTEHLRQSITSKMPENMEKKLVNISMRTSYLMNI